MCNVIVVTRYNKQFSKKTFRLITKYCKKENIGKNCLCFRFGSNFVQTDDSPVSLGIQDGDVIFAQAI